MEIFARRHEELNRLLLEGAPDMERESRAMKLMAEMEAAQLLKE